MLAPIAKSASSFLGASREHRHYTALLEFPAGRGVPDVVFVRLDQAEVSRREGLGLPPIESHSAVRALIALRKGTREVPLLSKQVNVSAGHLRRAVLPELEGAGFVRRSRAGWAAVHPYRPVIKGLVAVEAKMTDWLRGLSQARRFHGYANRAYLAIDSRATRRVQPHLAALGEAGIGVVQLDHARASVDVLREAKWRAPRSRANFALAGERAWAMLRKGTRRGPSPHVFGRDLSAT